MKTAVVILNWNGKKLMEQFLPSVLKYSRGLAEIVVADNHSSDDSISWLKATYPEITIVTNPQNEGYAKGYNDALKQVDADYFLLLNSDVEVTENWLQPLIECFEKDPSTAVCQPKLRWQKFPERFEYAGAAGGYIDKYGYPFCRGRIFLNVEEDSGQYNDPMPVFWASGACMMVRSEVFWNAGGFDDHFFAHMEEIDLCWRIRNMGYNIQCLPESVVYHVGGATLPKNNPRKTYLNFRNNLSMLYKNLPASKLVTTIFIRLVLDGVAGIKFLFQGGVGDCFAVFKAHMHFYKRVLTGELKRNHPQKQVHIPTIYGGNIAFDYFLWKKKKFTDLQFNPVKE